MAKAIYIVHVKYPRSQLALTIPLLRMYIRASALSQKIL